MSGDYDIVIIGGGLSGGSLALALQGSGYRIAVVEAFSDEQRRSLPAGDRALALSCGTVCHLKSLGLWDELQQHSAAILDIHISDRGHFGKTRLSARTEGVEALGYVIAARILEDRIASALEISDIERICPARLTSFKPARDSISLTLRKETSDLTLSTRLLVGADGVNSSVRCFLNIGQETRDYHQTAIVTQVRPDIDPAGAAFERFTATGPLAMLPTLDRGCSVVWTQTSAAAEQIMALDDKDFLTRLQNTFGFRLGRLTLESKRVQFPLKLVRAKAMIGPRSVLVGNTVHQLHPVAGQGFNLGMRDVALLAERIRDDLGKDRDPGGNRLLNAYAASRTKDHETLIRFTDGLVRIFSNEWLPLIGARGLGLLGLDRCYWGKHLFTRYAMGLGGRLPRIGTGLTG
ncbi:MAG: 2-octaprenyl-6-methoxyphenyl hydroxylase [Methylococcaceae bacterium]|nr:2-octaprenyl-6-methoxyphenyl hydroxylase [Methylococcaceae bacterium]MCI0732505.1 2-octaprenyl-6-methoxyphenyl hydroxylase [Methylococcaceae bacterium]